ncbi:MAG: hypothetical protein ABIK07_20625, partial [Planctomycetota bacterium]
IPRQNPDRALLPGTSSNTVLLDGFYFQEILARENWRLKTTLVYMIRQNFFHAGNIILFLRFDIFPEFLQLGMSFGIRDVLIAAPKRIQSFTQFMNHIVIVICAAFCFANVLHLLFGH